MSSKIKGLRRVGIVGLSTVVAASMMTLSGGSSFAAIGDYLAAGVTPVAQGVANAPASALSLEFANSWNTNATQTFTVTSSAGTPDCTTAAGILKAVSFSAAPTVTVSDPTPPNSGTDLTPTFPTVALSGTGVCGSVGVNNVLTITQIQPSTGVVTDNWLVALSGITYKVGANAAIGNISVATAGAFKATGSVVNAVVPSASLTNVPARVAAAPSALGVSLGTQRLDEVTAGALFPSGTTRTVTLTLDVGTFVAGVTPTITAPTGYTVTHPITVGASTTYAFDVTAATPAIAATVTVSGLKSDVGAAVGTRTITATGTAFAGALVAKTVNVLDFAKRTGGVDRYETAAKLFALGFPATTVSNVVLATGANFPDALSANFLAGALSTGTLLTPTASLSVAARAQIVRANVSTVYITGGFNAVSQAVQTTIEGMHVGDVPSAALITVVRLGGVDRYETNRFVNTKAFKLNGTGTKAFLASGQNFPDALAAGPVVYGSGYPLILTTGTTLGTNENQQLNLFTNVNDVVIAGGTDVVKSAVETSVKSQGFNTLRLAGTDRTQTAAAIASWATVGIKDAAGNPGIGINATQGFLSNRTFIATGNNFPDALVGGPVAGLNNQVIVLTGNSTVLGAGIPSYLGGKTVGNAANGITVGTLHALGETDVVPDAIMQSAAATISIP